MKYWSSIVIAALALALAPWESAAQGTCRCNNGCHNRPGQCVIGSGSAGCMPGYAPFCQTRAGSCPRTGWVSCSGDCICARIPGFDAGVAPDAPAPMDVPPGVDVARPDAPPGVDAPPADVPPGADVMRSDVPPGVDAPAPMPDAPPGVDVARPEDVPPGVDVPATMPDAPTPMDAPGLDAPPPPDGAVPSDVPCECDGGICYHGVCVRNRCEYQLELGFICPQEGERCVLLGTDAWCVPGCLGVSCEAGSTCVPASGNCERDQCGASMPCPGGLACQQGRCVAPDRDASAPGSDASAVDGGRPPTGVDDGSCGCRARPASAPGPWALLAGLAALAFRRRRRGAR